MTVFVACALGLVLVALAVLVRPLLRSAPVAATALALGLPLATGAAYMALGTPAALDPAARTPRSTPATPADMAAAVEQLAAEMERNPGNIEGWLLLARSRKAQQRYDDAERALEQASRLAPDDPDILVDLAETMTLAGPSRVIGPEAVALLERALALHPRHQRASWFLGVQAIQAGEPARAVALWEAILPTVDAATATALREQIARARAEAGMPPAEDAPPAAAALRVRVALAPEFAGAVDDGDTLYVFARQPDGAPMPVAATRLAVATWPVEVSLGDADSPMPTLRLSDLDEAEVVARISRSGDVAAASGDLESTPRRVRLGDEPVPVEIEIDRRRP
ncbi:tetratricopeptide repeat protein [Coralloluteibacterium stylophorae]|uniref:Tetratricopeptide repeat protein n=1 Tax=Coralloluteibacterium stylophorae TaxID=1776034 RepID=A0A8J7VWL8_9GAMM|nr:tetratricopeptide repeat protein [Coralloluteibacterium stylophorae]MBS7457559.1 tetratricopeptide repeat protein [Coralloluteibacterium stylophorae]